MSSLGDTTGGADKGYGEQISDSISNFMFGLFLLAFTAMAQWLIEKQAVKFAMILARAQTACRVLKNVDTLNTNYEGRMVLVKGKSHVEGNTEKTNKDGETGFSVDKNEKGNVVRLRRIVEMYQWIEKEHRSKRKGKTDEVTYTYDLKWKEGYEDSSRFHEGGSPYQGNQHVQPGGVVVHDHSHRTHYNPPKHPNLDTMTTNADTFIGAYKLADRQVDMMYKFEEVELHNCPTTWESHVIKGSSKPTVQKSDGTSYFVYTPKGASSRCDLAEPEPGLVRISYSCVYENGNVTASGVLTGRTMRPFNEDDAHATIAGWRAWLCGTSGSKKSKAGKYGSSNSDLEQAINRDNEDYGTDDDEPGSSNTATGLSDWVCCKCCVLLACVEPLLANCIAAVVGQDVLLCEEKHLSIASLFTHADADFHFRLRVCRVICVLLFWIAMACIFDPIATILSFIPLIGTIANSVLSIATFLLGMIVSLLVFAVSWTAFHPEYLGVLMLGCGIPCLVSTTASAAWVTFGQVTCGLSVLPFALFVSNWMEDNRFEAEQDRLDDELAHVQPNGQETTNLINR